MSSTPSPSSESSDGATTAAEGQPAAQLALSLFGPFEARLHGTPLASLRSRKGEWLLALLALRVGRPVSRDHLAATLWPDSDPGKALYNLRRTLHDLRHTLGDQAWRLGNPEDADDRALALDLTGGADVDVLAFDAALKRGMTNGSRTSSGNIGGDPEALADAVERYRGPFLEGCEEPWAQQERAMREEQHRNALERLALLSTRAGDPSRAADYLRRVLTRDPLRETALRALMEALWAAGDRASAAREFRDFRVRLLGEMNMHPSPETRALYERIKYETQTTPPAVGQTIPPSSVLEPAGGAVPIDSPYYIERTTDRLFHQAIARGDSILLLKGPRQFGKTSLLSRGLERARQAGCRVAITDLQKLTDPERHLRSSETLLLALGRLLADKLDLDTRPEQYWDADAGPSENFERFLRRRVLGAVPENVIWALDEVDQLFPYRWASEVFGLFRSWHNERALEPDGPWGRLTLVMSYATEAHLFITDLNQSPFNVGTKLTLDDFTGVEVADLDRRLGSPLGSPARLTRFMTLVGGHPDLVRRGLQELASGMTLETLEATAARDDGPFGFHLRRLLHALGQDPHLCAVVLDLLRAEKKPDLGSFYRLHSAGVIAGDEPTAARPRCGLYAFYLLTHLAEESLA
jgi:DNA-binding SARP family transcriptional activator